MSETFPLTWEEVARSHGRKIYNYAYRLSGNPHDASDLVQEVLLRVRRGLAEYQPGSFEGWLWRITRNAFLMSGAIALIFFVLFPVAPPRLATFGIVDTLTSAAMVVA